MCKICKYEECLVVEGDKYAKYTNMKKYLVMQSDCIKLVLASWRHIGESLTSGFWVLEKVLDRCLQVESLDKPGLVQGQSVSHTPDLG